MELAHLGRGVDARRRVELGTGFGARRDCATPDGGAAFQSAQPRLQRGDLAEAVRRRAPELAELETRNCGKPIAEAEEGLVRQRVVLQGKVLGEYFVEIEYDLPYEGLKAFLSMEGEEAGRTDPVEAQELADLPWEYLYNSRLDQFISLAVETPIVRYLEVSQPMPAQAVSLPLNVLVLISSPSDYPTLDADGEWQRLTTALEPLIQRGLTPMSREMNSDDDGV